MMEISFLDWMGAIFMVLQSSLGIKHKRAFRAFVGENIGEMLCFNVLLEVPFLTHCLLADTTIERSIFRC